MSSATTDVPSTRAITVCLVEDHPQVRDQLSDIFTAAGMSVVASVGTMVQGELVITKLLPDVAVIDNQLPDGTGIDLCRILSRSAPHVAVILHTGVVTSEVALDSLKAGAVAVIPKEIRTDKLLAAIRDHGRSSES